MRLRMRADARRGRTASASRAPGEGLDLPSPPAKVGGSAGVPTPRNVAEYRMPPAGACRRPRRWRDPVAGYDGRGGWQRLFGKKLFFDASIGASEGFGAGSLSTSGKARSACPES